MVSRGSNQLVALQRWGPLLFVLAVVGLAYVPSGSAWFAGPDVLTSIETSRITSWSGVLRPWTEPFMAGTDFVQTVALIYRPLVWYLFAADYALWGLNPTGYLWTNLALHLLSTGLLFATLRGLGASRLATVAGTLTFALHPAMAAAVPGLARRHDLLAGAMLLATTALVVRSARSQRPFRARDIAAATACWVAALLAKEPAFAAFPLVIAVGLVAHARAGASRRGLLAGALRLAVPLAAAALAVFAVRFQVLGALGGYRGSDFAPDLGSYRVLVNSLVTWLFWPLRGLHPESDRVWAVVLAAVLALAAVALWALPRPQRVLALLGAGWALTFALFFVALKTLAGAWYLYYLLIGVALLVAAAVDGVKWSRDLVGSRWRRAGLGLAAGVAALFVGIAVVGSPFVRRDDAWEAAGALTRQYLTAAIACGRDVPAGQTLGLRQIPADVARGTEAADLLGIGYVERYTARSAFRLLSDTPELDLAYVGRQTLPDVHATVDLACIPTPTGRALLPTVRDTTP